MNTDLPLELPSDLSFQTIFVDNDESSQVISFFTFLMPYIMMASKVLNSQDVSVKKDLLRKALFVHKFLKDHGLAITCVFHELETFIESLKACFPEHSEVTELPEFPVSGPRLRRMLLPVFQKLEKLMFPPHPDPEFGQCCSFGRCGICGIGEHFYSVEEMNVTITYTCPECREQGF
jgi:hypothetical protein